MTSAKFKELRRILDETAELLEQGGTDSAEQVLVRTAQLARTFDRNTGADMQRALVFRLGNEHYAWPVENVRSIGDLPHVTPVPFAPACYQGVISLRGQVLSVLDLSVYLKLPHTESASKMVIVIGGGVAGAKMEIGVLADDVHDVTPFLRAEMTPSVADLIAGVTTDGVSLLDAEGLLAREWRRAQGGTESAS
jgi:chemotaxis signal transduction protein